jgi:hypothetical protein
MLPFACSSAGAEAPQFPQEVYSMKFSKQVRILCVFGVLG